MVRRFRRCCIALHRTRAVPRRLHYKTYCCHKGVTVKFNEAQKRFKEKGTCFSPKSVPPCKPESDLPKSWPLLASVLLNQLWKPWVFPWEWKCDHDAIAFLEALRWKFTPLSTGHDRSLLPQSVTHCSSAQGQMQIKPQRLCLGFHYKSLRANFRSTTFLWFPLQLKRYVMLAP